MLKLSMTLCCVMPPLFFNQRQPEHQQHLRRLLATRAISQSSAAKCVPADAEHTTESIPLRRSERIPKPEKRYGYIDQ